MNALSDHSVESPARPSGRPRSEDCRQKILNAADELLARDGFSRMSIEAIARLAGTSKATIYRWWPSKAAIVMEALLAATEADVFVKPSSSAEEDLLEKVRRAIALFRGPKGRVIASLIGQAQSDREIGEAYRTQILVPRRADLRQAIERAIRAGTFSPDIDIDLAIDLLFGPLYQRLLLRHAPMDDAFERDYPPVAIAALRVYAANC